MGVVGVLVNAFTNQRDVKGVVETGQRTHPIEIRPMTCGFHYPEGSTPTATGGVDLITGCSDGDAQCLRHRTELHRSVFPDKIAVHLDPHRAR
jgi:hypothetical protein